MESDARFPPGQYFARRPPVTNSQSVGSRSARTPPKTRPIYTPVDVAIEAVEPAPHSSAADGEDEGEGQTPRCHTEFERRGTRGVMRVSTQPTASDMHLSKQQQAEKHAMRKAKKAPTHASYLPSCIAPVLSPPPCVVAQISYASVLKKDATAAQASASVAAALASAVAPPQLPYAFDLPSERDAGNVEYKWKLLDKSADRIVHLTTQLAYRLSEGNGEMLYELGVQDSGYCQGVSEQELDASIATVKAMADTLQAECRVLVRAWGQEGVVAEVLIRKVGDIASGSYRSTAASASSAAAVVAATSSSASPVSPSPLHAGDLRIALLGHSSSGTSSLLGCLVSNQRDDGRGRSRLHVFRHRHEIENGRTSAIARQILGFDAQGNITNYKVHHGQTLGVNDGVASLATNFAVSNSALPQKKKEKGISSLFGDDDASDDDEQLSESEDDAASDVLSAYSDAEQLPVEEPMISFQTVAPQQPESHLSLSLNGDHSGHLSQACSASDWQKLLEQSYKVYTIFDLPSDVKSTMAGLIGTSCPDYCCIVVSCANSHEHSVAANVSLSPPLNAAVPSSHSLVSSQSREQIMVCCALGIPFLLVLSKADLTPDPEARARLIRALQQICAEAPSPPGGRFRVPVGTTAITQKIPLLISSIDACQDEITLLERNMSEALVSADLPAALSTSIAKSIVRPHTSPSSVAFPHHTFVPLFVVSNVTGEGLDVFKHVLFRLRNYRHDYWSSKTQRLSASSNSFSSSPMPVEFSIDEIFSVDSVGSVVSGTILSGVISEGDTLLLGPIAESDSASAAAAESTAAICAAMFRPVLVKSVHISRKTFRNAKAGQSVTLALKKVDRTLLRRGMVLLSRPVPQSTRGVPRSLQPASTSSAWPRSCVGFEAYIRIFDPTSHSSLSRAGPGSRSGNGLNTRVVAGNALSLRYQPIVHIGNVRQSAEVISTRMIMDARQQEIAEQWIETYCSEDASVNPSQDLASLLASTPAAISLAPPVAPFTTGDSAPASRALQSGSCALVRFEFLYQSEYLRCGRQVLFREERTRGTGIITRLFFIDVRHDEDDSVKIDELAQQEQPISDAEHPSVTPSPALRSDTSDSNEDVLSPQGTPSPTIPQTPGQSISPSSAQSKRLLKKFEAESKQHASTSNVFQQAKSRRRNSVRQFEVGTSASGSPPIAPRAAPNHSPLLADSRSSHVAALTAASVPTTPALQALQPKPQQGSPMVASKQRGLSDSDLQPPSTHLQLLHASPPADYGHASLSPQSSSPIPRPPHSVSDSALSVRRSSNGLALDDNFSLPQSPYVFQSSLSTLPLTRILSEDVRSEEAAIPASSLMHHGLDESASEEDEDKSESISDFFGHVPKTKPQTHVRVPLTEMQLKKKELYEAKQAKLKAKAQESESNSKL